MYCSLFLKAECRSVHLSVVIQVVEVKNVNFQDVIHLPYVTFQVRDLWCVGIGEKRCS